MMKMESCGYISVVETEDDEAIEIPTEEDGHLLLENVSAQFPNASGLRYRTETNSLRAVRLVNGKLQPPGGDWEDRIYICSFPKDPVEAEKKRKAEDDLVLPPSSGAGNDDGDHSAVRGQSNKMARTDIKCTDLIVLGLSWKISEEQLRDHFSQFGELDLVQVKKDSRGQSRGYAFIRFSDISSQLKALSQRHNIEDRVCDVKIPNSKQAPSSVPAKIFVGRITEEMDADVLREYFEQYGEVQDIFIPKPFRAFAFITFKDNSVAQSICGSEHVIKDVKVRVNSASPRIDYNSSRIQNIRSNGRMGGGYSSYSGGNGGYNNGGGGGGGGGGMRGGNYGGGGGNGGVWNGNSNFDGGVNQGGGMGGGGGSSNLGSLNPMAVAAALNQAGLGSLLNSSYQNIGSSAPAVPPPNMNQAPPSYAGGGGWNNSGRSSSNSGGMMRQPPPSSAHSGGYHKSGSAGNWS